MKLLGHDVGIDHPLFFIAGPCVIEDWDTAATAAEKLAQIADKTGALVIYKSSFDKANRTSISSYRGPGIDEGLRILDEIRNSFGLPVLTDVHDVDQASVAASVVDVLQTPAFLARQTDFITGVSGLGKPVNIKKGQFMAPGDMTNVVQKAVEAGGRPMLCERGTTFGYGNLVVDMRSLEIMAETGWPVVFDATHSVQLPGGNGTSSGGERRFVPALARAAVAAGCDGVFMETHPDPENALCDGPNAWPLDQLEQLIKRLMGIRAVARS